MLNKKVTTREVMDEHVDRVYCDCCEKLIVANCSNKRVFQGPDANDLFMFYEVVSGHHDWGNDSVDSMDTKQYCSMECVNKTLEEFYNTNQNSKTAYFNIARDYYFGNMEVMYND